MCMPLTVSLLFLFSLPLLKVRRPCLHHGCADLRHCLPLQAQRVPRPAQAVCSGRWLHDDRPCHGFQKKKKNQTNNKQKKTINNQEIEHRFPFFIIYYFLSFSFLGRFSAGLTAATGISTMQRALCWQRWLSLPAWTALSAFAWAASCSSMSVFPGVFFFRHRCSLFACFFFFFDRCPDLAFSERTRPVRCLALLHHSHLNFTTLFLPFFLFSSFFIFLFFFLCV